MFFIIYPTIKQNWLKSNDIREKELSLSSASVGIGAGSVAILSGLGGGTIMIPILNSGFKMDLLKAKSISLGAILLSSLAATIFNWFELSSSGYTNQSHGFIVYPLVLK